MNNCIQDSKKSQRAFYKRYLLEYNCADEDEINAMTTSELKHEYEYWSVVLS
jgi:hypothetical protein